MAVWSGTGANLRCFVVTSYSCCMESFARVLPTPSFRGSTLSARDIQEVYNSESTVSTNTELTHVSKFSSSWSLKGGLALFEGWSRFGEGWSFEHANIWSWVTLWRGLAWLYGFVSGNPWTAFMVLWLRVFPDRSQCIHLLKSCSWHHFSVKKLSNLEPATLLRYSAITKT